MADRPIIFSGPMVRALLAGTKTQTRRLAKVKLHPGVNPRFSQLCAIPEGTGWRIHGSEEASERFTVPYAVGGRLWVREAHALLPRTAYRGSVGTGTIEQREHPTDGYTAAVFREGFDRSGRPLWRPSIHMPRWASRLTLTVTEVRVQRLQDISEEDARAEGAPRLLMDDDGGFYEHGDGLHRIGFAGLWAHLHGPASWDASPWVAAISFTTTPANIDSLPEQP